MDFGFENLEVWTRSVDFAVKVIDLVESMDTPRKHFRLLEQIEASSSSISMNTCPDNSLRFWACIILMCSKVI
ncbi:four helix bundle protein [Desulfovermiculus halophilus]|uniref:four helix bundle protein n=1 Tax=Desulfovermiculus halophilus TaxID=339722 RepID=UPI000A034A53